MFTRKTLFLSIIPSLAALLVAGLLWRTKLISVDPLLLMAAAYIVGLPFGIFLVKRHGRFGPLLRPIV